VYKSKFCAKNKEKTQKTRKYKGKREKMVVIGVTAAKTTESHKKQP